MTANDYDLLPYRSVPYATTQPAHLAAVGTLFGLSPVLPEKARVLELGCASGGNLIPLALRYPNASFVGIDLSARQVQDGQDTIQALGQTNIEIKQGDLTEATFDADAFDYVICHGVFSWIPKAAQDAVFRIAKESLTPDGMLYVSYNIFPGWRMRMIVRDICAYHAGSAGSPEQRVARARWAMQQMAENSADNTPYGQMLRNEAQLCSRLPDSYILGEFLADHNDPCYFHEFLTRAADAGLSFLSETELSASLPEAMPDSTAKLIRNIAGDNGMAVEQYMDFFGGRQFRRSVMIRTDQATRTSRNIGSEKLQTLHLASPYHEDLSSPAGEPAKFTGPAGQIQIPDAVRLELLRVLERAWPGTKTPAEIHAHLTQAGVIKEDTAEIDVLRLLFSLVVGGHFKIYSHALTAGRADAPKPEVCPLARHQAKQGQAWVATRLHTVINMPQNGAVILQMLDGTKDRETVVEAMIDALLDGTLQDTKDPIPDGTPREKLRQGAEKLLANMLMQLERQALLVP